MARKKAPAKPTMAQFREQMISSSSVTDADWDADFGEIWYPVFPIDDLRGHGNLPNTPKVWYRSLHTISLMTALGTLKPHPLRCTESGALYVASGGATQLTPYESTVTSGSPYEALFAPRPTFGVEVSNDGSDSISVQLTSNLSADGKSGNFTGVQGVTVLATEKFSWAIEAVAIRITTPSSVAFRVQALG